MVGDPVAADHREADEEADELGGEVVEGVSQVVDAVGVLEVRHLDPDDEQRHGDREEPVAEGEHAAELVTRFWTVARIRRPDRVRKV